MTGDNKIKLSLLITAILTALFGYSVVLKPF